MYSILISVNSYFFFVCKLTNIETLFMFVSLKLPTRKLSEYEEEVKLLEGDLKWSEFKAFILKLCFIYFTFVSS